MNHLNGNKWIFITIYYLGQLVDVYHVSILKFLFALHVDLNLDKLSFLVIAYMTPQTFCS